MIRRTSPGLRFAALGAFLACVAGILVVLAVEPGSSTAACEPHNSLGRFSAANQPSACWRPYESSSPFNRRIPADAPATGDSARIVSTLLQGGTADAFVAGDSERDGGVPIYWSKRSDPVFRLHCMMPWGDCELQGLRIHVPAKATPQGGYATPDRYEHDAHMTVIDQRSGIEYDLWHVVSRRHGTINFGWGGKTRIDGNGLGSAAVAANYGTIAGPIRFTELRAGAINHALAMVVPCTDRVVYPATGRGLTCGQGNLPSAYSIPMGSHFQLDMAPEEIAALGVPEYEKTILNALATYGAYVSDTSGDRGQWGFERESSQTYTSFGKPDPWVGFAQGLGIQPEDYNGNGQPEYWMNLSDGVPWERLRLVKSCVARDSCS
jgi:hypothetical protein